MPKKQRGRLLMEKYSRILAGSEPIRTSILNEGHELISLPPDATVTTAYENIQRAAKLSNNSEFIGERIETGQRYAWLRYEEIINRAQRVGAALIKMGLSPGEDTRVGFIGVNTSEYFIGMYACISFSMTIVPLYRNYVKEALSHIINKCHLTHVFCDTAERIDFLLELAGESSHLETIILMKGDLKTDKQRDTLCRHHGIELLTMNYLLSIGDTHLIPVQPPKPHNIYMICHTSGTTGFPKGVMLTHENMVANMAGLIVSFEKNNLPINQHDVYLSFLPLAHIFEQLMQMLMIYERAKIGFYGGNVLTLKGDFQTLKPSIVTMVPRLLNKMMGAINDSVANTGAIKQKMFKSAVKYKTNQLIKGKVSQNTLWDKVVLKKVRAQLGGRLRVAFCGGAPVSPDVLKFWRAVFGMYVIEGYGQTECACAATACLPQDTLSNSVGAPTPWCHIKLIDVPELGYWSKNNKGEVLIRGAAVMKGYFDDHEATKEAIDPDGWLHTGDIGLWNSQEALQIIDRRKQFFKLAQGDYVSPEVIQNAYMDCSLVSQAFVDGESLKAFLVAIVVPNETALQQWANQQQTLKDETIETIYESALARDHVLSEMRITGADKGLNSLQQVRAIHLTCEVFTDENGLLTPTMKLKRAELRRKYKNVINNLYAQVESTK